MIEYCIHMRIEYRDTEIVISYDLHIVIFYPHMNTIFCPTVVTALSDTINIVIFNIT